MILFSTGLFSDLITELKRGERFIMFVVFVALLSSASAAKYCCAPPQWEGDMGIVMGIVNQGQSTIVEGTMTISTDEVNEIVAFNQTLAVDGKPVNQRIVNDKKNNVMYIMDSTGCHKTVASPFLLGCIPDNATETTDNIHYGLGSNSVKVKAYTINYPGYSVYMAVTADSCVPVTEVITGSLEAITGQQEYGPSETIEALSFANISPGIANRGVFDVPAQCEPRQTQPIGRRALFVI